MNEAVTSGLDKKAVVLAGGGSRGAYQIGAFRALKELGYEYSLITGCSVGSLNGALMTTGNIELGEKMWQQITTEMILDCTIKGDMTQEDGQRAAVMAFVGKAIKDRSIDQTPLKELLTEVLDIDAIYASDIEFGLVTVEYPSFAPLELFLEDIPKEKLIDYLMASSAFFPAMKTWQIDGKAYADGGFYDNMPINMAIKRGATEIVAIGLNGLGKSREPENKRVKLTKVLPRENLGFELIFDSRLAQQNIIRGYNDTLKTFGKLDGWCYTFEKGAFDGIKDEFMELCTKSADYMFEGSLLKEGYVRHHTLAIMRKLVKETSAATLHRGWVYAAAEIAGKMFGLDTLKLYSGEEFIEALLASFDDTVERHEAEDPSAIKAALNTITDDRALTRFVYGEIQKLLQGEPMQKFVTLLGDIRPAPIIAALFLTLVNKVN